MWEASSTIQLTYPHILNFTLEDSLNISFIMNYPYSVKQIKLNPDSNELICSYYENLKECSIPLEHFLGKKGGYYFTNYNNNYTFYDAPPFKWYYVQK